MQQFFVDAIQDTTIVSGDEFNHLRVLRLKVGERLYLSDGKKLALGQISRLDKDQAYVEFVNEIPSTEPPYEIVLYQGIPKGDKMDFIVQKAIELGVRRIVPVHTKRSVAKWDKDKSKKKIERLNRVAIEAAKQSHRVVAPVVEEPLSWKEFVVSWNELSGLKLVFWEVASEKLCNAFRAKPNLVSLLIGPEGGLSEEEISDLNTPTYTLGKRILRTETAGIVALSQIMYGLELEGDKIF